MSNSIGIRAIGKMQDKKGKSAARSIHDLEINSISGDRLKLSDFEGKFMLLVNVASKCGFTRQYKALQELSDKYKEDLVVIGFPCNQFGNQEPGSAEEIQSFCDIRFGVSFPMTEKVKVKGPKQHPVYEWLTKKSLNGKKSSTVHWNFQKYLIDPKGHLVDVFYSTTSPTSRKITRYFQK